MPIIWLGEDIGLVGHDEKGYHYQAVMPIPGVGWRGFLVEGYWPGPNDSTFQFTSQVSIIPQTQPYPNCTVCDCVLL